jgi:kumamolisin
MPAGTDGAGQTLAIIELGGGFGQGDLDTYFSGLGIATPTVTTVGVDSAVNTAGQDPHGADGEVLLDIEVAGAIARPKLASWCISRRTPTPVSWTRSAPPRTPRQPRPR